MRRIKAAGTGVVWVSWMNTGTLTASEMALKYARISETDTGGAGGRHMTAAAPRSTACRLYSTAVMFAWAPVLTTTGTRPRV